MKWGIRRTKEQRGHSNNRLTESPRNNKIKTIPPKLGDTFGKAGILVNNPKTKIDWSKTSRHGRQRMAERGITTNMLEDWVKNGKVLEQAEGAKHLFFTQQGAVVVATDGTVITAIPEKMYDTAYKALSTVLFGE